MNREDSAKFSFYLSAPVVAGAALLTLLKDSTITLISANISIFVLGILISFVAGLICIKFLLKYIKTHDFKIFMWYRLALGVIVLLCLLVM